MFARVIYFNAKLTWGTMGLRFMYVWLHISVRYRDNTKFERGKKIAALCRRYHSFLVYTDRNISCLITNIIIISLAKNAIK